MVVTSWISLRVLYKYPHSCEAEVAGKKSEYITLQRSWMSIAETSK